MAVSTCSKCGGHSFRLDESVPSGANYKLMLVQCSSCGVPVGVVDYYNLGALLKKQEAEIENLKSAVSNLSYSIGTIDHNIANIAKSLSSSWK